MNFTGNPTPNDPATADLWGTMINTILDELKAAANTLESGKADASHGHAQYAAKTVQTSILNRIDAIESVLATIDVDLTNVNVALHLFNVANGLRLAISTVPTVFISRFLVEARLAGGSVFFSASSFSSITHIPEDEFNNGDVVEVRATLESATGSTKTTDWYSITYNNAASVMTVEDVILAFRNDASAIQELANALHNSNTLAQKVAELNQ